MEVLQSRFIQRPNPNHPNKPARRKRHGENQAYQEKPTTEVCVIHTFKSSQGRWIERSSNTVNSLLTTSRVSVNPSLKNELAEAKGIFHNGILGRTKSKDTLTPWQGQ